MFSVNTRFAVTLFSLFDGTEEMQNRFTLEVEDPENKSGQDVVDVILAWAEALCALLAVVTNAIHVYRGISIESQDAAWVSGFVPLAANVPGELTGDPLPSSTALLMSFPTSVPKVVGKKMFGGLQEEQTGGTGNFSSSTLGSWTDVGDYLTTTQGGAPDRVANILRTAKTVEVVYLSDYVIHAVPTPMTRRKYGG